MDQMDELWDHIKSTLQKRLTEVSYATWIGDTKPLKLTSTKFYIKVPTPVHKNYWSKTLLPIVVESCYMVLHRDIEPIIVENDEMPEEVKSKPTNTIVQRNNSQLNPRYTFENFVIGKGNQFAHAAALVCAENEGNIYNPLFFYGGVGLGKTHLMQAIGNYMIQLKPNSRVKYVTSETFTNDLVRSIRTNSTEAFREEYRNLDLLMVDDVQFFADKESTQEEFFHTFNFLFNNEHQIVLTSDRIPEEINNLEERLVSRFKSGLAVDITPPDFETRIAILSKKADNMGLDISDDVLYYISGQIDSNVRELEGSLTRIQAYATTIGQDITVDLAAEALKTLLPNQKQRELSILDIQETVAKFYHVSVQDLKGKKRHKTIVTPRQISMYLAREMTNQSLPKIGNEFGGKDHSTVLYAYDKIKQELEEGNRELVDDVERLIKQLKEK
ncbi:chromosomal replication initiator protein DnaA [Atopobacter sp. AH10]|uniref:chromosomal replication initiator protein DnaA n=1 Tax=Atopobacter sp. AH10 TaxID=2315861 RepID=UPI000EF1B9A8|nr:chromosomal replication initiator protein DnaA [Atopobacter sp. AH10]RLK62831.1 chromosomal replication initiator protein DnaA [Atopobacter sp. AH10]